VPARSGYAQCSQRPLAKPSHRRARHLGKQGGDDQPPASSHRDPARTSVVADVGHAPFYEAPAEHVALIVATLGGRHVATAPGDDRGGADAGISPTTKAGGPRSGAGGRSHEGDGVAGPGRRGRQSGIRAAPRDPMCEPTGKDGSTCSPAGPPASRSSWGGRRLRAGRHRGKPHAPNPSVKTRMIHGLLIRSGVTRRPGSSCGAPRRRLRGGQRDVQDVVVHTEP